MPVRLVPKKSSTFHDFPYSSPERKCLHCWIINVTPPGPNQCLHSCIYCYASKAIYSNHSRDTLVYSNLPELVDRDLSKLDLCPPVSVSNVSDPCQAIPELRREVKRLIQLLMDYGVSFFVTTKNDASFLLELPRFAQYRPKFVALTIEGTQEMLETLSPGAPSLEVRAGALRRLSTNGIDTVVRLDPVFVHLLYALYGDSWLTNIAGLLDLFASAGTRHVTAGTGRLFGRRSGSTGDGGAGTWQRMHNTIRHLSPLAARAFEQDYVYEADWSGRGYRLRRDLRLRFHRAVKDLAEARGLTYASCQELSAAESDSGSIPHCEGLPVPFTRKQLDGRFRPVPGCTANCHVSCRHLSNPPCRQPKLISPRPVTIGKLR